MRRAARCAVACLLCIGAVDSRAATRGLYGGMLRVALAGELPAGDPILADAPAEAAILGLTSRAVCRLHRDQRVTPGLALAITRASSQELRLTVRSGLRGATGEAVGAGQIAQSWMRLSNPETRSPYRALLFPVRGEGRVLQPASETAMALPLTFPWPDLERSLCHPALAVVAQSPERAPRPGHGPFLPADVGVYVASMGYIRGRPYADRLTIIAGDARATARALALGEVEIALGASAEGLSALPPAPALFATYLAFHPKRTGLGLRDAVERLVDRADLTRFFVRSPAVAMTSLLPAALMPQQPAPRTGAAPGPAREVILLYDASLQDQRPVAERLQLKLHDAGYRVALRGLSRSALRTRWASGDFDLMLHAVLLPPLPAPALAIVLELAGRHDLLLRELPALGAVADGAARDARARERALALQPGLALLPLYAQGLSVLTSPKVTGLDVDGYGVPLLDDAFLSP